MISLLLLDLDGVVVYEMAPPRVKKLELILLHDLLVNGLQEVGVPVVVLTHRSRAEAAVILGSAGIDKNVAGLMAAEDILNAALMYGNPWQLLRKGLRKSWTLPAVERRYRVDRKNIAFIDDRLDNIEDLVSNGVGMALHAPSGINDDGSLISFDFQQVVEMVRDGSSEGTSSTRSIAPRIVTDMELNRTGISTGSYTMSRFNRARRFGRSLRERLWQRSTV
jgi:hypothetical protein